MRQLTREVQTFIVETELEAADLIQEFKDNAAQEDYELTKYQSVRKTKKKEGEIIDEWFVVTIQKDF